MPYRKTILANGETYHLYNKSFRGDIFTEKREYDIFLLTAAYYLQKTPPVKFSIFRQLKSQYPIENQTKIVNIIAYCLMPNHFHFVATQLTDRGIQTFMQKTCNSYAHYFNLRHEKKGTLFDYKFQARRVENQEQLAHLTRYIHLNPVTSYLVENPEDYPYSSYQIYLNRKKSDFIDGSMVMENFQNTKEYRKFVMARKEYQRELSQIQHLIID